MEASSSWDEKIHHLPAEEIAKRGIIQIIEGRRVFGHLTVEQNLRVGAHLRRRCGLSAKERLEMVYQYFPEAGDTAHMSLQDLSAAESSR